MPDLSQFHSLVNALGWMLVHFLWQGFAIAGLLWAACRLSRSANAEFRYWSGLAAYFLAALVPLATFLIYLPTTSHPGAGAATLPAVTVLAGVKPSFGQFLHAGMEPALPVVVGLWALGVAILSSRTLIGWLAARNLVRLDARPVNEELRRLAGQLMIQLGVRRVVRVLRSTRVAVPTVIGWLRPVILIPASVIARLPVEQLEMVIAHELGHIRRHDYLVNLLQLVIETLFFYHPAVRWMSRQVRQEREHCCDDLVVSQCGRPVVYARALANLEILREPMPATVMSATGGDLLHRVRRIVRGDMPRSSSGFAQVALLLSVAAVVSLGTQQGVELGRNALGSSRIMSVPAEGSGSLFQSSERGDWIRGIWRYAADSRERRATPAPADDANPGAGQGRLTAIQTPVADPEFASRLPSEQPVPEQPRVAAMSSFKQPVQLIDEETLSTAHSDGLEELYLLAKLEHPDVRLGEPALPNGGESAKARKLTVQPIQTAAPNYPFKARNDRVEGFVRLGFRVDRDGRVQDIEVADAMPEKVFNRAARKALKKWRFEVAEDHEVGRRLYQTFDFAMADEPEPEPLVRQRRCDSTGSKICGMFYNRDHVQYYGAQKKREAAGERN